MNIKAWIILLNFIAHFAYGDQVIQRAFSEVERGNFDHALDVIKRDPDHVAAKILMTRAIFDKRCSEVGFKEAKRFIHNSPDWPQNTFIKNHVEKLIDKNVSKEEIFDWFSKHPPSTPEGFKYYALSIPSILDKEEAKVIIKNGWVYGSFSKDEQPVFLKKYSNVLNYSDHLSRINELLWNNNAAEATRMLHLIKKEDQRRYVVRIAIINKDPKAEKLFRALPKVDKFSSGVLYSYLKRKRAPKSPVTNVELHLAAHIPSDKAKGNRWWDLRSYYIRELMDKHRYHDAYRLAKNHACEGRMQITQAEWLAGWLALRYLHTPKPALEHFKQLYNNCSMPISRSRGAYWIARSYKTLQMPEKANEWFKKAARHGHTFYGQMAQYELGYKQLQVTKTPGINNDSQEVYEGLQIIQTLAKYDQKHLIKPYVESIFAHSQDPRHIHLILEELDRTKHTWLKVEASRQAAFYGVFSLKHGYPVLKNIKYPLIETPLIHSIIRQESSFDVAATDPTGGHGLMQLLASTAKNSAKSLGMTYNRDKLLKNPEYNIMLGSKHLADHLERYKGSLLLAIPSYNAGQHRVDSWIKRYGDPRKFKNLYSIIDLIERIPFSTTRDYVHRIMENLQVYKLRIKNDSKLTVVQDLKYKEVKKHGQIAAGR